MVTFIHKDPLDLEKESGGEVVEFLEKVEQCGRWPQQACTTMFFLIPNNVARERHVPLVLAMIRWCEAVLAPEVANWQKKKTTWDATVGALCGETLLEMERFNHQAGDKDEGAVALCPGPGKSCRAR